MSDPIHTRLCPLCSRTVDPDYRPFCSRRCADIDLGNWLNGAYAIPSLEGPTSEEEEETLEKLLRGIDGRAGEPS